MMSWIWLNMPLGFVAVAVTVGLPLWTIVKFPEVADADPRAREGPRPGSGRSARSSHRVMPVVEPASPMWATGGAS